MSFAFLNGRIVPESEATVSVMDRAFLYGDGVFETLYALNGRPVRLEAHLDRLWQGADLLNVRVPFTRVEITKACEQVLRAPAFGQPAAALLRLTLSRGVGARGYSPRGAEHPTLVITRHPATLPDEAPARWTLLTASFRLPAGDRIAAIKSCNKLAQVLARAEAEAAGADEALLLNTAGRVVEAAAGNLFFIENGAIRTPPLLSGILPGVTRAVVLELCRAAGVPVAEAAPSPEELARADGVFLTLSTQGIVAASSLDGQSLAAPPLIGRLHADYWRMVARECDAEHLILKPPPSR